MKWKTIRSIPYDSPSHSPSNYSYEFPFNLPNFKLKYFRFQQIFPHISPISTNPLEKPQNHNNSRLSLSLFTNSLNPFYLSSRWIQSPFTITLDICKVVRLDPRWEEIWYWRYGECLRSLWIQLHTQLCMVRSLNFTQIIAFVKFYIKYEHNF